MNRNKMKKNILYGMMAFFAVAFMSVSFTSCGNDEPDNPDPVVPPQTDPVDPPQTDPEDISQKDLIGTWRYTASDYDDIDYISFNGSGRGIMVNRVNLFSNASYHYKPFGVNSEMVYFSYSIDGTSIHVMPVEAEYYDDFIITVNSLKGTTLDVTYGTDVKKPHKIMKHFDNDWEWFAQKGPASVDLTSDFVGFYEVESDRSHKLEVTKINKYTVKIKDLKFKTELIGELHWDDIFGSEASKFDEAGLYKPHSWEALFISFTLDGKMWVYEDAQYHFSGYAVKTDNGGGSQTSFCDDERIYGNWTGTSDGETFTLSFDDKGLLEESWTDGSYSDFNSMEYVFLNGELDFPDLSPIFANSIGNPPFKVKFSSGSKPSKMTISDDRHSITFNRK